MSIAGYMDTIQKDLPIPKDLERIKDKLDELTTRLAASVDNLKRNIARTIESVVASGFKSSALR